MPRPPLPHTLGLSFRVGAALSAGAARTRLETSDLRRVFHGARMRADEFVAPADAPPWVRERADLERRIAAYLPLMPEGAFLTGPTAAFAWGAPLPLGVHGVLFVAVHHPRTAPLRAGIRGVHVLPRMARVVARDGVPVTDPASTWASLGGVLGLYDLVAVADAFIRVPRHPGGFRPPARPALATREELAAALTAGSPARGGDPAGGARPSAHRLVEPS